MINKKRIFIIFAMLAMLLSGIVSLGNSHIAPNAFACQEFGGFMGREEVNYSDVIFPRAKNRKWTVEELFSHGPRFSTYYGEGEGTWLYADKVDRGLQGTPSRVDEADWNDNNVQNNLKAARTLGTCLFDGGNFIPNIILGLSSAIVWLTNKAINFSIGDNGMVESIGIIVGGDGSADNGLIATFRSSLYMPLVVIAFVLTGFTIAKKGLIDGKLREALSSAIWSVMAFVVGLTLMFSPSLLAKIPQAATNTISTCILGALGGQNCLNSEVTTPSMLTGNECRSEIVGGKNGIETAVNSMNCSIWKAFVLEPWAEEQFGAPYKELYTHNIPQGGTKWVNTPEGKEELYCVNLASTKSASNSGQTLVMDLDSNSTVCNVALYQMYLRTYMEDPINHDDDKVQIVTKEGSKPYDIRWFDIIVPMAKNSSSWTNWAGTGRVMHRFGASLMGVIAVVLSSGVLLMLSIFGATYKVIGAILMAFSPIFLLFAIEPNRGRKIFLGWLESVFSSILKYFAITMLMVVSLVLYSGVLSNTSGLTSFVSIIVLTVALWMYRKEVVDLIGASNMGGQRLSNKTNEMMEKAGKVAKEKGQAYVGGRIGGAWGAKEAYNKELGTRRENLKYLQNQLSAATTEEEKSSINSEIKEAKKAINKLGTVQTAQKKGAKQGGLDSLQRSMKRGTSITASAFSQADRTKREMIKADEKNKKETPPYSFSHTNDFGGPNGPNDDGPPNGPPNGPPGGPPNDDGPNDDFNAQGVKAQRKEVSYDDSLSEKEVAELKEFEDKLAKILNDDELLEMANDEELMQDGNKRALMQNELNARIRYNSLNGIPSGDLSRHELANPKNISNEELILNLEVSRENFLENGDTSEYNKYQELLAERAGRGLITPNNAKMEAMAILDRRKEIEDSGKEYVRDVNVPTSEEVKQDPTKYLENEEVKASPRLLLEEEQRLANESEESKKTTDNEPEESKKATDNQAQAERTIDLDKRANSEVDKGEQSKPKNTDEAIVVAHQSESAESIKDGMASEKEVKVNRADTALPDLDDKQNSSNKMDSPEMPSLDDTAQGPKMPELEDNIKPNFDRRSDTFENKEGHPSQIDNSSIEPKMPSLDDSAQGPKMPSLDGNANPIPSVIPVPVNETSDRDNNQSHQDSEPRTPGTPLPELNEEIDLTSRRTNRMNVDLENSVPSGKPEKQEFAEESSKSMDTQESRHTASRVENTSGKPEQAKSPQENKRTETMERNSNRYEQQSLDLYGKLPELDRETKTDGESSREQEQTEAHYRERTPGPQQKVEPRPEDRDYFRDNSENKADSREPERAKEPERTRESERTKEPEHTREPERTRETERTKEPERTRKQGNVSEGNNPNFPPIVNLEPVNNQASERDHSRDNGERRNQEANEKAPEETFNRERTPGPQQKVEPRSKDRDYSRVPDEDLGQKTNNRYDSERANQDQNQSDVTRNKNNRDKETFRKDSDNVESRNNVNPLPPIKDEERPKERDYSRVEPVSSNQQRSNEKASEETFNRERTPGPQQKVEPRPKDRDYSRVPDKDLGQKTNNRDNSEWANQDQNQSNVTRNKNDRAKESFRRDPESVESRNNVNPLPSIKNEEVTRPENSSRQDTDPYASRDNSQGTTPIPPIKNEERPKERDYSRIEPASSNQQRVEEPTRVKPTAKGKAKENRADSRKQQHEQTKESSSKPVNSGQQESFASNDVQAPSLDRNDSRPLLNDEGPNESSKQARNTESTSTETKEKKTEPKAETKTKAEKSEAKAKKSETKAKKSEGFSNPFKKDKEVEPSPNTEQLDLGLDFDAELDFLTSNVDELETINNQEFNAEDDKTLPTLD